jgi:hypothetical protein
MMAGPNATSGETDFVLYRPDINAYWKFSDAFTSAFPGSYQDSFLWHYNGTLYAAGGTDNSVVPDNETLYSVPLPTAWRDASYSATWTTHGVINIFDTLDYWGRGGAAISGDTVFIWGGTVDGVVVPNEAANTAYVSLASLPNLTWSNGTSIDQPLSALEGDGAVIGTTLYRGGGVITGNTGYDVLESLDLTDPTDPWTNLAAMPFNVWGHVMVTDGTDVWTMGGYDSDSVASTDKVSRYSVSGDTWAASTVLPSATNSRFGYYYDNRLWYFRDTNTIYTYPVADGLTGSWSTLSAPTNPDSAVIIVGWRRIEGSSYGTEFLAVAGQGPFDPVRADARADALSVARNFNAPPVDVNLSQSFLPEPLEVIDPDIVTAFDESLTPGTAEFYYLPLGRQSSEYLQEFTGETMLARMGRTFPGPIMELVSNISDSIIADNLTSDNTVDARYAIEYVFRSWAADYPWFASAAVPDLRVPLVGGDYSGDAGKVFTRTITIPQGDDAERSMFDIAQELLAPFGAVRTVNDNNVFAIQPRYGPDSDATAVVTLKDNDLYSLSTGDPSRVGTKNRITVEKRPYDRDVDVIAMQEAYWQIRHSLFDAQYLITDRTADPPDAIPDTRLDLTDGTGTSFQSGYALRYDPLLWPAGAGIVPEDVGFVDTSPAVTLDVDFYAYNLGNTGVNITKNYVSDAEVTLPSVGNILPDGNWYTALTAQYSNSSGTPTSMFVTLEGRWVNERGQRGIQLRVADSNLIAVGWTVGVTIYPFDTFVGTFAIKLTDASAAWVDRGTSTRVTFGIAGTDTLPSATGDAVAESQDARGILEEVISIGPYNPSLDQMSQMAEGILFDKIQPRSIVRGEQSVVRAFPVRFSHLGRLVQLPDGTSGDVMSRDYREASPTVGGAGDLGSGFEVMILNADAAGAVDTTSDFLLSESGSNLLLETGDSILLEAPGSFLLEDGSNLLLEAGDTFLLEA